MKFLSVLLVLIFSTSAFSQDYYWVGGTGNWSDYYSHWATSSGGNTFHASIPTTSNNVFFDANSFGASDQVVTLNEDAECADMDWSGVTNIPTFQANNNIDLTVNGSITMSDNMNTDLQDIVFNSSSTGETITAGSNGLGEDAYLIFDNSTGEWILQDSLAGYYMQIKQGTIDLNDQPIYLSSQIYSSFGNGTLKMTSSKLYLGNLYCFGCNVNFDAGTSTIYLQGSGGAGTFGSSSQELTFNNIVIDKDRVIQGDLTFNELTINPGYNITINSGDTLFTTDLIVQGTKSELISIQSGTIDSEAIIKQTSGIVAGEYLELMDIHATGGATFNAANSIDLGNNTGWNISAPSGSDYYWVGESGNWSDYANHWAISSGGSTYHTESPGTFDNVNFDLNSFSSEGTVTLDMDALCGDLTWSGITNAIEFTNDGSETLSISGSLNLTSTVVPSLDNIYFTAHDTGNTITTGAQSLGSFSKIIFTGTGEWTFQDSISVRNLAIQQGTLNFNGQPVSITSRFDVEESTSKTMNFGSSTIYTSYYYYTTSGLTLDAGTSRLVVNGSFGTMRGNASGDIEYYDVVIDGSKTIDLYDHSFNSLEITAGSTLKLGDGETFTMNDLIVTGNKNETTSLKSSSAGNQATISIASGTIDVNHLTLQDVVATGGATFNALDSYDDGNNTGWTITPPTGTDYFWIGEGGNWSDLSHWATTSGGSTLHTELPGPLDNVFFDANSFNSPDQEVEVDSNSKCHDLSVDVDEEITLNSNSQTLLGIHGSIYVNDQVYFTLYNINMNSDDAETFAVEASDGSGAWFNFYGSGSWTMMNDFLLGYSFYLLAGTLDFNDYQMVLSVLDFEGGNLDLGSSQISARYFRYDYHDSFDAGISSLSVYDDFWGGDLAFHDVTFTNQNGSVGVDFRGSNTFNSLTIEPGTTVNIQENQTQTITSLSAAGSSASPIVFKSKSPGTQTTLSQSSGTVEGSYLELQDIVATGGATFNALESTDNGNNSGWTFLQDETAPSFITNYPNVKTVGGATAIIEAQVDEPATFFYVVLPDQSTAPSASQVIAGTNNLDEAVPMGSEEIISANTIYEITIDGLEEVTTYDIFIAIRDGADNVQSSVEELNFTTIDVSAPTFTNDYPAISFVGSTTIELSTSMNESGNVYYVFLMDGASIPTSAQVKAGTDATDGPALKAGTIVIAESENIDMEEVSSLTPETPYDIFIVAEDASGNLQSGSELLEATTTPEAKDYYWVGDTGDWSDFANHWATSSGGSVFHSEAPTQYDNVFFDENSFTLSDQEVVISEVVNCQNMDWTGVTNFPTMASGGFSLNIYGSMVLSEDMEWSYRYIEFESPYDGNTITLGNLDFPSNTLFRFFGNGSWILQDSLKNGYLNLFNSSHVDLNDQYINVDQLYLYSNATIDMGSSKINARQFRNYAGSDAVVTNSSELRVTSSFYASGATFNNVIFEQRTGYVINHTGDALIDTLILEDGVFAEFQASTTISVNQLVAEGTKSVGINLFTNTPGSQVTFNQSSGTVNGNYLIMQDVSAAGGAQFNADNTIDKGNNTGWNITPLASLDYFWVGGTGNWSDFQNHWATASGGSTFHTDVPGRLDNVYIDANSFLESGILTLDINAQCSDLDWTGLGSPVTFNRSQSESLYIYGSMLFSDNVDPDMDDVYFESANTETITTSNKHFGNSSKIWFVGEGEWTFLDSVKVGNLAIELGTLNFNDQIVEIASRFDVGSLDPKTMNFGNSTIYTQDFYYTSSGLTLDAGTSTLYLRGYNIDMRGNSSNDIEYNHVVFDGNGDIDFHDHSFESLEIKPGSTLRLGEEDTLDVSSLTANGVPDDLIIIQSRIAGTQGVIRMPSGTVDLQQVRLKDVLAMGGATFNAIASFDDGNNTGWNFIKGDQTIIFDESDTVDVFQEAFILDVEATSGLDVSLTSSDESVATINGTLLSVVGAGSTTITASQTGDDQFNAAEDVQQLLVVEKVDQLISFDSVETKIFTDEAFNVTVSASSGLEVTLSIDNESVATITDQTLTIIGTGTANITASQGGDDDYNAAPDLVRQLVVNKADQIIQFDAIPTKTFGDEDFLITASASSELDVVYSITDESIATISGDTITVLKAGATTVTASQTGNSNFNPAEEVIQDLVVNKASQLISFSSIANKTFGDPTFDLEVSNSSGLEISLNVADTGVVSLVGHTASIVGAGATTITASQPGNENYSPAEDVIQQVVVNKADQIISFDEIPVKTFGDPSFDLVVSNSIGMEVTLEIADTLIAKLDGTTVTIESAGLTTISANQNGDSNYNAASEVIRSLTVSKAGQSITFSEIPDFILGEDNSIVLDASASSGLAINYQVSGPATLDGSVLTPLASGNVVVTASQTGNVNYIAAEDVVRSFDVIDNSKTDQSISFENIPQKTFGDDPFELIATASSGLAVLFSSSDESVISIDGTTATITGAGNVTLTGLQEGNESFNSASTTQGITVNKADQTITFLQISDLVFGDDDRTLTASASSGLEVSFVSSNHEVMMITGNVASILGAGTVTITADQAGNENYNPTSVSQEIVVGKANQTILFDALPNFTLGDPPITLVATSSSELEVSFEVSGPAILDGNTLTPSGAGTVAVTAIQTGNNNYLSADPVIRSFAVIDPSKSDQTITFDMLPEKQFGDDDFTLTASSSSGLPISYQSSNEGVAIIMGNVVSIVSVGQTEITASQDGDSTYNAATPVTQILVVNIADQSITFEQPQEMTFGDGDFVLNATSTSGLDVGFVSTDEQIVTIEGNTVTIVSAGHVDIIAAQSGNESYLAALDITRTLIVNKASQSISFDEIPDFNFDNDAPFQLEATASSGLEVAFEVDGPASLDGLELTPEDLGTVSITATQPGNTNYLVADPIIQSFEVFRIPLGMELSRDLILAPNPTDEYVKVVGGLPGEIGISIYTLGGELVVTATVGNDESLNIKHLPDGTYIIITQQQTLERSILVIRHH